MKKYFIIAASAAFVLASCAKVDNVKVAAGDQAITFEPIKGMATKADDKHGHTEFTGDSFGSFAYYYVEGSTTAQLYIENARISDDNNDGVWVDESHTYYWPKEGTLDFYAYTPYLADPTNKISCDAAKGITATAYTVLKTADKVDFMVAYPTRAQNSNNSSDKHYREGVSTVFEHKLTKITFRAKTNIGDLGSITVNDIYVQNINNVGNYNQNADTDATKHGSWNVAANTETYDYIKGNTTPIPDAGEDYGYKLLLPQDLVANNQQVVINYTVVLKGTGNNVITYPATKTVDIVDLGIDWVINRAIVYNIDFKYSGEDLVQILWDPCEVKWDEQTGTDIVL